jgi:beta-lactamase family protein
MRFPGKFGSRDCARFARNHLRVAGIGKGIGPAATAIGVDVFDRKAESGPPPRRRTAAGRYVLGIAFAVALAGCAEPAAVTVPTEATVTPQSPSASQSVAAAPMPKLQSAGQAEAAVAAVERWADGHPRTTIGAAVLDRATGELAVGRDAAEPLYSASLSKLIVVVDVLQRARTGLPVTDQDRDRIRLALGPSDDEAMNALWSRFDGLGAVSRVAAQLGLQDTRPPASPARWGETLVSARDIVRLYDHVLTEMPAEERDFVLTGLADAPDRAADGFDQSFGLAGMPSGAVKSGWMCCQRGRITLHSAGIIDHEAQRFVVALLSSQPSSFGYARSRDELTDAANAALDALN